MNKVPSTPAASPNDSPVTKARTRLSPDQRVPQILDAALHEFTLRGFNATRMDDIAARCGLSKGGLYAHFESKDAIFKALLDRSLNQVDWHQIPKLAAGASNTEVAEWIVDRLIATLLSPHTVALVRLLIPERERAPTWVNGWKDSVVQLRSRDIGRLLAESLGGGPLHDSVLVHHPWLALSPIVHVLLWRAMFGTDDAPDPDFRQAHVDMLRQLLGDAPGSTSTPSHQGDSP